MNGALRVTANWFEAAELKAAAREPRRKRADPIRWIPCLLLHGGRLGVNWVGWSWAAALAAISLYFVRLFAITGFYHRFISHKSLKIIRWPQFLLGNWGKLAAQRGPICRASQHQQRHRRSNVREDAHSPARRGFDWSHMGWLTAGGNLVVNERYVRAPLKLAELRFLDRLGMLVPMQLALGLFLVGWLLEAFAPGLGTNGWRMPVWGFFIFTVAAFHATCTINSLSHPCSSRGFVTRDDSRNSVFLASSTLGEGWHNDQRRFTASAQQGSFWWGIDLSYCGLILRQWFGLTWDLKPTPEHVLAGSRRSANTRGNG